MYTYMGIIILFYHWLLSLIINFCNKQTLKFYSDKILASNDNNIQEDGVDILQGLAHE